MQITKIAFSNFFNRVLLYNVTIAAASNLASSSGVQGRNSNESLAQ